jgi:hypothetical protein
VRPEGTGGFEPSGESGLVPACGREFVGRPGTYMFEVLRYRDQWESRLLRTSAWSPLY